MRIPLATHTDELQGVDEVLDNLEQMDGNPVDPGPESASEPQAADEGHVVPDSEAETGDGDDLPMEMVSLLRVGIDEMSRMDKVTDYPEFFLRLARRTGLRLVLLKRWTSGLQVFMEENIQLPAEAKKKRRDGRAPIPTTPDDIFQAITEDATVYAGPVPVKHFPLDLTLMLGRGSRDRQILILPLPSQNHWNTFLYLDADRSTEKSLAAAEILAHYGLSRMCLLNKGVRSGSDKVSGILKSELHRRQEDRAKQASTGPMPPLSEDGSSSDAEKKPAVRTEQPNPAATAPPASRPEGTKLTPEAILQHSGELPALPKAACHIMAVIEDPATTATKLEHALAMDQALTAKVLRIANSPFYGAVREITTVSEAIVRLGFVAIRNWTLVTAARSVFLSPGSGMLYQKIWRQSVMSAMAGQLVAKALGNSNPDSIFIGGLMQNIGQLVLARSHPELFQEILVDSSRRGLPYHVVEQGRLGFDHGELGAQLIKEWNLSPELEGAVRWHHRFELEDAQSSRAAAMIALGEEIALTTSGLEATGEEAPGASGDEVFVSEAAKFLGMDAETLAELKARAAELKIDPHFFS
jgi:HD-like signal output (HDOD) protein